MKTSPFQFALSTAKAITLLLTFLAFSIQTNATGALDPTFGTNGRATVTVGNSAAAKATVIQPDGKIIVAGDAVFGSTGRDIVLVRLNLNGSLDESFGDGGRVVFAVSNRSETINSVALQSDGRIVIVGNTEPIEGAAVTDFLVVRFNADGGLDTSFGNNGVVTINQGSRDVFNAVAVQSNGKIVAAGSTSDCRCAAIARFNPNGSLDNTFNGGLVFLSLPYHANAAFNAVALTTNGQVLACGSGQRLTPPPVPPDYPTNILALLNSDGSWTQNFGDQGVVAFGASEYYSGESDAAILSDGTIVLISDKTYRFSSNGTLYTNFTQYGGGSDIALRSDDKFVTTGLFSHIGTMLESNNGILIGREKIIRGNDVAVQPDDKIILINSTETNFIITRLNTITSLATRLADNDEDGKTNFIVYRPDNRTQYTLYSINGDIFADRAFTNIIRSIPEEYRYGLSGQFIFWRLSSLSPGAIGSFQSASFPGFSVQWGAFGDIPVGGDYDGDTYTDVMVYRPSEGVWHVSQSSNNQSRTIRWGLSEDKPVPADYDYDGITDIAVFRPSNGFWYVRRSSDGEMTAVQFGLSGDTPLTGDFDGDGRADFVVYRPSEGVWYLLNTTSGFRAVRFGLENDQPVPGDYDGDGRHDIAVFRSGIWYILGSTRGFYAVQWGLPNDVPVAVRYAY